MLHVVILAGGSGTRFWPLSRRDRPKQFLELAGSRTLLQQAYDRVSDLTGSERVHIVTGEALAQGVKEQLPDLPHAQVSPPSLDLYIPLPSPPLMTCQGVR